MKSNGQRQQRNRLYPSKSGLVLGMALLAQASLRPPVRTENPGPGGSGRQKSPSNPQRPLARYPPDLLDNIISDLSTKGNYDKEAILTNSCGVRHLAGWLAGLPKTGGNVYPGYSSGLLGRIAVGWKKV